MAIFYYNNHKDLLILGGTYDPPIKHNFDPFAIHHRGIHHDHPGAYCPIPDRTHDPEPYPLTKIDGEEVAQHIGLAIQMKTINNVDPPDQVDPIPFKGLHNLISTLYPEVEEHLKREVIGDYSLFYTWEGSDPHLDPIMLTAHMDVVPPANEAPDSAGHIRHSAARSPMATSGGGAAPSTVKAS